MSLIKKSNELVIPTTVKMMIYGQAGMGKSTVALSAPKPLLLDFDNGVKRMNMAHLENIDTVQVTSWSDVQQVLQEDLSAYQTIVVDTIGKMMDFIITHKYLNIGIEPLVFKVCFKHYPHFAARQFIDKVRNGPRQTEVIQHMRTQV